MAFAISALSREFLQYRAIRALVAVAAFHQVLQAPADVPQLREPSVDSLNLSLREAPDVRARAMAIAPKA